MNNHIIISGCSGGGKSTLLSEFARRGFSVVEEPGRRIVRQQAELQGTVLPWVDPAAFAKLAIEVSLADIASASDEEEWIFFDRGLIDAAAALQHCTGEPALRRYGGRYGANRHVFLTPPWPDLFSSDVERRHGFADAVSEYERLLHAYVGLRYVPHILPMTSVACRADFVLSITGRSPRC